MAEGKEEEEEGRKREASSINGLHFCSPARQFAFFFLSFLVIHFAGAMILSHSFWGSLQAGGDAQSLENDMAASNFFR